MSALCHAREIPSFLPEHDYQICSHGWSWYASQLSKSAATSLTSDFHVETDGLFRVMTVLDAPANRRTAGAPRKTIRHRFSRMCLDTEARRASNVAVHDRP